MFSAHGVLDTADAGKHWTVLVSPSSNSTTLDGSWDMIEHPDFIDPLHGSALSPMARSNSLLKWLGLGDTVDQTELVTLRIGHHPP